MTSSIAAHRYRLQHVIDLDVQVSDLCTRLNAERSIIVLVMGLLCICDLPCS